MEFDSKEKFVEDEDLVDLNLKYNRRGNIELKDEDLQMLKHKLKASNYLDEV